MDEKFDKALRHALTPAEEPDFWLNQKILNQVKEQSVMTGRMKRKLSTVSIMLVLVLCLGSATVYAAWKYLSASDVAKELQDIKLADAFSGKDAVLVNETQTIGKYRVTFLSMISGEMLSDYETKDSVKNDRTYAVVAIENADGTPLADEKLDIFVSLLIGDYDPTAYNIASMSGNYAQMEEDGVVYRLIECDSVEIFADHTIYLCITDETFYNPEAYQFDKLTGVICRNKGYEGLNALFEVALEETKADLEKAAAYMETLGFQSDILEDKINVALGDTFSIEETAKGGKVAAYALSFLGNPYAWGKDSLTEGTDSSGFVKSVYAYFHVELPHDSRAQLKLGTEVASIEDAEPGDLVFYNTPSHVAIYIGDGKIIHAMPQIGICISEVDFDDVFCIRKMIKN